MPLLENLFSHGAVERLGWMLVHFLWQAVAVALLLAVLLKLLRRASANLRYLVACGTLALMVATPLVTMQFIDVPGPVAEAGSLPEILTPVFVTMETIEELPPLPSTPPVEITDLTVPIPWHERLATALEPGLPYVVLGWFAGVLGLSVWHLGGWTQLQRLKRRMVRETGDALHATLDELATRLGVRRVVTLLESAFVEVPTVVGWLSPTILLPASALTGLSPDQLRAILAHELAHIRRYDYLANIVQTVVEILGFYHPAVWWVSHQIRIERENCCDDLAVRVCDNSLQYARALASMEEIRHSQSELAMAASGGSLMARIARLLGRPVVDDRRFTWLPGLIALLLVVGVVIPAALVMAAPATEPASQVAKVVTLAEQSSSPIDEPARTQVLLAFTVLDIVADRTLDADTAAQARPCLARIPSAEGGTISASAMPPLTEELLLPLRDVFTRFTPIPEKGKDLTDLLISRGYATVLSKPMLLTFADEPASISLGEPDDPNAANGYMRLNVTAHVLDDRDATRLEIDYADRSAMDDSDDPNRPMSSTQIASTLVVPNDEYAAIVGLNPAAPGGSMHILLIGPIKVNRPQPTVGQDPGTTERTVVKTLAQDNTEHREQTQVLMEFIVAKALTESVPDRGTFLRIAAILAAERPQITSELANADEKKTTLGEVLRRYVTSQSLSQETGQALIDLLKVRGLVEIQSKPKVLTSDGQEFEVRSVSDEQFLLRSSQKTGDTTQTQLQKVEYGTWIKGTPRVESDKSITVEMAVRVADPAPKSPPSDLPVVRTQAIESTMTVTHNRYFSLLVEPGGKEATDVNGSSSLLILFKPKIDENPFGPANPLLVQSEPAVSHPRQVLLDVRVVEMEPGKQRNLGVEWGFPASQAGQAPADSDWTKALSIGYSPDQTSTDSLVARLNQLGASGQVKILSNPQIVTLDGHPARLQSIQEEWFLMTGTNTPGGDSHSELQRIDSGTILDFTPYVGDGNDITLVVGVETSKSMPQNQGDADLPIVTRRQARNKVTVQNGGTVALAGLIGNSGGRNGPSTKDVAIFVTAHVIPR